MYLNPFAKRMAQAKTSTIKYSDMFQKKLEKPTHGIIYSEGKLFYKKKIIKMSMSEAMLSENSIISPIEQQGKFRKQF